MDPYWMFKASKNGEVKQKLFTSDKLPKGWSDSPGAAKEAAKKPVETDLLTDDNPEVDDGNSTRTDQLGSEAGGDIS